MMRRRAGRIFLVAVASALLAYVLYLALVPGEREGHLLHFVGGAGEVGGSCLLVDAGTERFLIDCGSGFELDDPDPPRDCSFAIVTHAHLDHCGRIPALFEAGFTGRVYCTPPTADLVPVMLRMARGFEREKISDAAFERSLAALTPVPFDSLVDEGSVRFRFCGAGHLLGAAFVEIDIGTGPRSVKLVVSGDLGSGNSLLVPGLEACKSADYVVMESTYGGVVRDSLGSSPGSGHEPFARSVSSALARGGDVLIPAFTLGRTQEVMAAIELFRARGLIPPGTLVYVDSPTAHAITEVYRAHADELSPTARSLFGGNILEYPALREVRSRTSMKVHERKHDPTIFISSSGNVDYANSPRHLMRMYADRRNLCCIVGYQAPGSTGAGLERGDDPLLVRYREGNELREEWISPSLEVASFDCFSGHADHDDLIRWLGGISGVREVFLVHGEEERSRVLAEAIEREWGLEAVVPARGETHRLRIR